MTITSENDERIYLSAEQIDALMEKIYNRLRAFAEALLRGRGIPVVQATVLVDDAWMKLRRNGVRVTPETAVDFFAFAAAAVRQALTDAARHWNGSAKRGEFVTLMESFGSPQTSPEVIISVHNLLDKLKELDPVQANIFYARHYFGASLKEIAWMYEVSERTVRRNLDRAERYFKANLRTE